MTLTVRGRTDEALVRAIRGGDLRAFDELYRRYADRIFGFLVRHVHDRTEAEDLLQDVFMTVLRDDALELRPGKVGAWLFTVARNRAIGKLRRRRVEDDHLATVPPPDPEPSPEAQTGTRQLVARVEGAMTALSEPHAEALMLKVVGGLTYKQIAAVQDVPEGTAKSRLHFALRAVRAYFEREREER